MGLFSGGNSDSRTIAPQTGAQSQVGDPLSLNISAGDDQRVENLSIQRNLTLNQTDYGAIAAGFGLAENAATLQSELDARRSKDLVAALEFAGESLAEGNRVVDLSNRRAFEFSDRQASRSYSLAGDAVDLSRDAARDVIDFAGAQNTGVLRFAADSQSLFGDLTDRVIGTVEKAQRSTEGLAANVLDFVQQDREPLVQGVVTITKQVAIAVVVAVIARSLLKGA